MGETAVSFMNLLYRAVIALVHYQYSQDMTSARRLTAMRRN